MDDSDASELRRSTWLTFNSLASLSLVRMSDMSTTPRLPIRTGQATLAAALLLAITARAAHPEVLITEVVPNVNTTPVRGDTVELFNTGPAAVDLTGWVLTDLDSNPVAGVPQDASFAPMSLALPTLGAGEFAVIEFVDVAGAAAWTATNYGFRISAPLVAGSFLGSERDELLLLDAANTPIDFVAWSDTATVVSSDSYADLSAVTGATFDYGLTPGSAAWDGIETITTDAEYYAASVDFTAFASVSTWGGGAIRRRSTAGVFDVGSPDGTAQWEAVARHQASLGNPSDDVPTGGGLRPLRVTDDLSMWLAQIKSSTFPERRIALGEDQMPASFVLADNARRTAWEAVLALAFAEQWDQAFAAADAIGYEVVEFLDTASGEVFHLLRERTIPGEVGYTGMGSFVFYSGPGVRQNVVLEVPHPIHDSKTIDEGALALPQVFPRVLMVAGAHRNHHPSSTTCDGTFDGGAPYHISDVAHHPDNFFHITHLWLGTQMANMLAIQFHGFCCPGAGSYASLFDDVVLSNGVELLPGPGDFTQIWRGRIDAQSHMANGIDLTTAAVFGDDATVLGATNNLQGRVTNGVAEGLACNTAAVAASGRFIHIEQDPDVRDDPQHIITALIEALDLFEPVEDSPCDSVPAGGCRTAAAGKSAITIQNSAIAGKDRFGWKWNKGQATTAADFGDPLNGSARYHVCVYDGSGVAQPILDFDVPPGGLCSGKPCWKAMSTKGFSYRNRAGSDEGMTSLKLKAGAEGSAKVQAKAGKLNLSAPSLPLSLPVTVQLLIDDGVTTQCWQSTFSNPPTANTAEKFRAKQ